MFVCVDCRLLFVLLAALVEDEVASPDDGRMCGRPVGRGAVCDIFASVLVGCMLHAFNVLLIQITPLTVYEMEGHASECHAREIAISLLYGRRDLHFFGGQAFFPFVYPDDPCLPRAKPHHPHSHRSIILSNEEFLGRF